MTSTFKNRGRKRSRSTTVAGPASKRFKKAVYINRYETGELKFHDDVTQATVPVTGILLDSIPTGIANGTGESQRIGRQVTGTRLNINGVFTLPSSAAGSTDVIRMMVVQDKQANGADFTSAELLQVSNNFLSYRNLENSKRFRVFVDKRFVLDSRMQLAAATTGPITKYFSESIKLNDMVFEYSGTDGLITELKSNNLGVFFITEKGLIVTDMYSRLRYRG